RDAVDLGCLLQAREAVQHVGQDELGLALDRIAVAARVRHGDLDRVAGLQALVRELRGPALLVGRPRVLPERRSPAWMPSQDTPGWIAEEAVPLAGDDRVGEEAVDANHADPAAPLARGGMDVA